MTATQQPRQPLTRRAIRVLRRLDDELLAAGEAMARVPQQRPQADPGETTPRPAHYSPHGADERPTRPPAQVLPAVLHL